MIFNNLKTGPTGRVELMNNRVVHFILFYLKPKKPFFLMPKKSFDALNP